MIKYLLFFLTTFFLFSLSSSYKYYLLTAQKWCTSEYQIHGLWPQYDVDTYPSYCIDAYYVEPEDELKNEMEKYWSSCDNSDLWKHEWLKHGTCTEEQNNFNEYTYFNTTVNLFSQNLNLIDKCDQDDCTLGCFDLDFKLMECPSN